MKMKYVLTRVSIHEEEVDIIGVFDDFYKAQAEMQRDVGETADGWGNDVEVDYDFTSERTAYVRCFDSKFFWVIVSTDLCGE